MPNTGKPSLACHLCRQRRVKCDLERPGCRRCVTYGTECPGYRDLHELVFRNADAATVEKKKNLRRAAARQAGADEAGAASGLSASATPTPTTTPTSTSTSTSTTTCTPADLVPAPGRPSGVCKAGALPRSLAEHWTAQSVPFLLNVYSSLYFLQDMYRRSPPDGPLVWAAHVFTRTYVINMRYPTSMSRHSLPETQRELGTYLGKTLRSVCAALKTPQGPCRDDVLATVWILASYELLVGSLNREGLVSPWHLHVKGLYNLLKARGSALLHTYRGRMAFWPCYNMLQIQALVRNTECPPESDEWLGIIRDRPFEGEAYTLGVSVFITACTRVQMRAVELLLRLDVGAAEGEYRTLVGYLRAAEQQVDDESCDASDDVDRYMRVLYDAALVKSYHLMQLLGALLMATHQAGSTTGAEQLRALREYCLQRSRSAGQCVVDSIPWAVVEPLAGGKERSPRVLFDALRMVWPLATVYGVSSTLPAQKREAEAALLLMGREIGVREALDRARGGSKPTLLEDGVGLGDGGA